MYSNAGRQSGATPRQINKQKSASCISNLYWDRTCSITGGTLDLK